MPFTIRRYAPTDETDWLRCRALSFLATCYYDDVWTTRPSSPAVQLVATDARTVIGILDVEIDGDLATIDTVAVHPDHQSRGVASQLLDRAWHELPAAVTVMDAWTREDVPALAWYRARGFAESEHYLHVCKTGRIRTRAGRAPLPSPLRSRPSATRGSRTRPISANGSRASTSAGGSAGPSPLSSGRGTRAVRRRPTARRSSAPSGPSVRA